MTLFSFLTLVRTSFREHVTHFRGIFLRKFGGSGGNGSRTKLGVRENDIQKRTLFKPSAQSPPTVNQ